MLPAGHGEESLIAVAARAEADRRCIDAPARFKVHAAGGGEIPQLGVVGTLHEAQLVDHLRDEKVYVRVALAMAVAAKIDRHAVHPGGEVRAVIEVEPAEK